MRIAVSAETNAGLDAPVNGHFGHSPDHHDPEDHQQICALFNSVLVPCQGTFVGPGRVRIVAGKDAGRRRTRCAARTRTQPAAILAGVGQRKRFLTRH